MGSSMSLYSACLRPRSSQNQSGSSSPRPEAANIVRTQSSRSQLLSSSPAGETASSVPQRISSDFSSASSAAELMIARRSSVFRRSRFSATEDARNQSFERLRSAGAPRSSLPGNTTHKAMQAINRLGEQLGLRNKRDEDPQSSLDDFQTVIVSNNSRIEE